MDPAWGDPVPVVDAPAEQGVRVVRSNRRGAVQLLRRLREGTLEVGAISTHERRVCVAYLRLEGYTHEEVAEIFGVHRHTIARDEKANRAEVARLVDELDVRSVAGGLIAWAKHLTAKAIREKDYGLAWRVQREVIADLQSLGFLPKAAERHEVQIGTFADLARLALDQNDAPVLDVDSDAPKEPVEAQEA
jgi:hypothetical protein